ncbi:MAG: anthranilate synthase component I [Rhodothermaceae bacterium]|nr:anthranilate synthase component I [Bacteroidota bacterium]MXW15417.1 anthranilate synthase component I [Rhodothermaceae bacterium]MDE2644389.1 anthranilate synthase component I [Bacteroidota bacterium]MXW31850.1 anthranilate synthase component I [Rhodothermaceae bacterium]MXX96372.1 anthranilate synthase component I [Rhodothermaceae bacterium]
MKRHEFQLVVEREQAKGLEHFVVPVNRRLSADLLTPVSALLALRQNSHHAFLLESVEGGENMARYSFLGRNPYRIVRSEGREVTIEQVRTHETVTASEANIFDVLCRFMDEFIEVKLSGLPRFRCGAVGYIGYDNVRLIEHLPNPPTDDVDLPDAIWCFYDTLAAFDRVKHQIVLIANVFITPDSDLDDEYTQATERIRDLEHDLQSPFCSPDPVKLGSEQLTSNFAREDFEAVVTEAKQRIYEGDIFQVVLSQRFSLPFEGDPFNLYRALRQINPSPYLFYLDLDEVSLIGSSPEVLVRVEDRRAELLPIAGTRPRGETPEEDEQLAQDLLLDAKERAEHLMLVDLGRNDLGRISKLGSVTVDRYAYVERYSHVMHIVSAVSGLLRDDMTTIDVLPACFPAGTVSGAPKVKAMEIIDELEPTRRGIYAGAVGYIDFSGNMDMCIAIRTMVVQEDQIFIQAGAGIVADSIPALEYEETKNKARALRQALLTAAQGLL